MPADEILKHIAELEKILQKTLEDVQHLRDEMFMLRAELAKIQTQLAQ